MKRMQSLSLIISLLLYGTGLISQNLKPYTIGAKTTGAMSEVAQIVETKLKAQGFNILGSYMPVEDKSRWVVVYTSEDILNAVRLVGGLTGLAAAWRVAITDENGEKIISYTTPAYWGNAYFRDDFPKVERFYKAYADKISRALADCGTGGGETFGSEEGYDIGKLRAYRYMATMPKFDRTKKLNEFTSYDEAVATVDANFTKGVTDLEKVYSVEVKDQKIKLYGIGLFGDKGESHFMRKIDINEPKHTAFLPYEFLIIDNEVHMLHGRFRIALSFPDLKMGQFMKIVSTPPNIKKLLETATQ